MFGKTKNNAIRIFLTLSVENNGLPFPVQHKKPDYSLEQAIRDSREMRNLNGPFESAEAAVESMLGD